MTIPTKKLKNRFEMPVFGLGTWLIGGTTTRDPDNDDAGDIQAIKNAIDMGITHIDTAECTLMAMQKYWWAELLKTMTEKVFSLLQKFGRHI